MYDQTCKLRYLSGFCVIADSHLACKADAMLRLRQASLIILEFCLTSWCFGQAAITNRDGLGNREILDRNQGWTVILKDGTKRNTSPIELENICSAIINFPNLSNSKDYEGVTQLCDDWALLHPTLHIQRVPFRELAVRLLLASPPSSDFRRYRGIELKRTAVTTTYDSTIMPDDIGANPSCTVDVEDRGAEGTLYTFACQVKTSSYAEATRVKEYMKSSIADLYLEEDEIREHGLLAHARESGLCAPTGECIEGNTFITATHDWKTLQIEANPVFVRNVALEVMAQDHGKHARIGSIADDEAEVTFEVFSVGPSLNRPAASTSTK